MRSSTRPSFFALVMGLWIISCAIVFVSVLVAPPARGQTPKDPGRDQTPKGAWWSPEEDERRYPQGYGELRVVESAGEVVLKFTTEDPGRTEYYTKDGDCSGYPTAEDPANETPVSPDECGRPYARAGEDYGAVRGEWTFNEAGFRTIRIPIVDDDFDETDGEAFTIIAVHQTNYWPTAGLYNAFIAIGDDDPKQSSDNSSSPDRSNQQAGSQSSTSARRPSPPSTVPASTGSPDAGNQSGSVLPGDLPRPGEPVALNRADPSLDKEVRVDDRSSPLPLIRSGALLLMLIAAVGFALKRRSSG